MIFSCICPLGQGVPKEAMAMLQHYNWPSNYTQFKRILNELALVTSTPYISAEHVAALLQKEKEQNFPANSLISATNGSYSLDLTRSLDEIIQEIIHKVLVETGGNQSAAAKRLFISRTTLWRYLKADKS